MKGTSITFRSPHAPVQVQCEIRAFVDELLLHKCCVFKSGKVQVWDSVKQDWSEAHGLSDSDLKKVRAAAAQK